MEKVIEINRRKIFSIEEANEILPVVLRITMAASQKVQALIDRLDKFDSKDEKRVLEVEEEINSMINAWQAKIEKLGAYPKGLWIADFDNGDGYLCWKYPETEIQFFHRYDQGFSGRIKLPPLSVTS